MLPFSMLLEVADSCCLESTNLAWIPEPKKYRFKQRKLIRDKKINWERQKEYNQCIHKEMQGDGEKEWSNKRDRKKAGNVIISCHQFYLTPSCLFRLCSRRCAARVAVKSHWSHGSRIPSCLICLCFVTCNSMGLISISRINKG